MILRMSRGFALAWLVMLISVGLSPIGNAQQSRRTADLRAQSVPIMEEQLQGLRFRKSSVTDSSGADDSLPLKVTVQSITPVSKSAPTAIVELLVENIGKRSFSLPTSREVKVLHYDGNQDRRIFFCQTKLTPPATEIMVFGAISTYSSSNDPASLLQLRPEESVQLTYEANFESLFGADIRKWHDGIANGAILARVDCFQQTLTPHPDSTREQRHYLVTNSEVVQSGNALRLSLNP